jgi:hypothetical protein
VSPRDEQEAEAVALRAGYPAWDVWRGVDNLWHARWPEHYDPEGRPVMVWGEDPVDLRDQIRRETGRAEEGLVTDAETLAEPRPKLHSGDDGE